MGDGRSRGEVVNQVGGGCALPEALIMVRVARSGAVVAPAPPLRSWGDVGRLLVEASGRPRRDAWQVTRGVLAHIKRRGFFKNVKLSNC